MYSKFPSTDAFCVSQHEETRAVGTNDNYTLYVLNTRLRKVCPTPSQLQRTNCAQTQSPALFPTWGEESADVFRLILFTFYVKRPIGKNMDWTFGLLDNWTIFFDDFLDDFFVSVVRFECFIWVVV